MHLMLTKLIRANCLYKNKLHYLYHVIMSNYIPTLLMMTIFCVVRRVRDRNQYASRFSEIFRLKI